MISGGVGSDADEVVDTFRIQIIHMDISPLKRTHAQMLGWRLSETVPGSEEVSIRTELARGDNSDWESERS